jgi:carboxyvinyl-carboxyphosphonate phosphorylmutase
MTKENFRRRRQRLREILGAPHCVSPAPVFDPLSARAAEDLGFEIAMLAGSAAALTVLGAPDLVLLTLSELAEQAHRISRASALPLLVDADHGYGNALNVRRTVEELEGVGVAGLTIEDTLLPARHGQARPELVSIQEGAAKMRAAVGARQSDDFVVVGRTSAASLVGIGETLARCQAYIDEGVDALFLSGIADRAMLETIVRSVALPLIVGSLPAEMSDRSYLADHNVRILLQGQAPLIQGIEATYAALKAMRSGIAPQQRGSELVRRLSGETDYRQLQQELLQAKPD